MLQHNCAYKDHYKFYPFLNWHIRSDLFLKFSKSSWDVLYQQSLSFLFLPYRCPIYFFLSDLYIYKYIYVFNLCSLHCEQVEQAFCFFIIVSHPFHIFSFNHWNPCISQLVILVHVYLPSCADSPYLRQF